MLHEFLIAKRAELIERCRVKVSKRSDPKEIETERAYGIPYFLDQLIETQFVDKCKKGKRTGRTINRSNSTRETPESLFDVACGRAARSLQSVLSVAPAKPLRLASRHPRHPSQELSRSLTSVRGHVLCADARKSGPNQDSRLYGVARKGLKICWHTKV
jgi:hypothetical protein